MVLEKSEISVEEARYKQEKFNIYLKKKIRIGNKYEKQRKTYWY